ncbi:MAG TPA: glycogen debranching protein GlgX [Candidatus Binataceae bacterium]|nr:glycogen debranching protein GlgX [Candidatus Binataceae bacterium]
MSNGKLAVWRGTSYPLGATWDGQGVNFALFSEHAERVQLCIFDARSQHQTHVINLPWQTDQVWHCYLPEMRPGTLYGYRVYGPYDPKRGLRFNPNKLLLDPYAKQIVGPLRWSDSLFGYRIGSPREDFSFDRRDSAPAMPKSRVIETAFSWADDKPPATPLHDTVIYELHVKGLTARHPDLPPHLRGSYAGLATEPMIEYFQRLGVTALELMPVHAFIDDRRLIDNRLRNYWGYNSVGYFAPDMRYSASGTVQEFKSMVKRLHSAGLEVILDVVYNHTAEGSHLGPTLSFRGIDNEAYYRLSPDDPRYYVDFTGCGNTLNMRHPRVLQLIMDSLRYWVQEMHVDGFRFDLAAALARELFEVDKLSAFFDIVHQDPILAPAKLIAEPWDLGQGGYQVGNFPIGWAEWNGRYRDAVRAYWKGEGGIIGDLAYRLTGSSDLYGESGRRPYASVNFVTCHDGFTLRDLVSYNQKHNEANGEDNRDGENNNLSWNCGVEGPTDDPSINRLREQQQRNFLATLMLSQGVPMLSHGDELGRTQQGNNNAYCQDSELSWTDWSTSPTRLLEFVRRLIALRKRHPVFRRRQFFQGRRIRGSELKDIMWLTPDGDEMTDEEWNQHFARCLGVFLAGSATGEIDERGLAVTDDDFVLLLNSHYERIDFHIPPLADDGPWRVLIDTSRADGGADDNRQLSHGEAFALEGRSLALLTRSLRQLSPAG